MEQWSYLKWRAPLYHYAPRVMLGDFNDIRSNEEKEGGLVRPEASFSAFREMIEANGLQDIMTGGGHFTWVGVRHEYTVRSRIDRVMANSIWLDLYPSSYVQLLRWMGSDHRPLLLSTDSTPW